MNSDVRLVCVKVMNCATQTNNQMLLKDWEEFFMHPER